MHISTNYNHTASSYAGFGQSFEAGRASKRNPVSNKLPLDEFRVKPIEKSACTGHYHNNSNPHRTLGELYNQHTKESLDNGIAKIIDLSV